MDKKTLLPSQKDEIFRLILEHEFEPSDFAWDECDGRYSKAIVSRITHKPTNYYFTFDVSKGRNRVSEFSPGEETHVEIEDAPSWAVQADLFTHWLDYLKREIEAPDYWSSISQEARVLEAATSTDTVNTPFTAQEKVYIISGLSEIRQFLLSSHKLDPELIEARLNYLVEASERVGRKDWINLLISVLVGIVVSAALPPETTRELFRVVGIVLREILSKQIFLP